MPLKKPAIENSNRKGNPEADLRQAPTNNLIKQPRGKIRQLNILVPEETLRDFKMTSLARNMTMGQLWQLVWDDWRAKNP